MKIIDKFLQWEKNIYELAILNDKVMGYLPPTRLDLLKAAVVYIFILISIILTIDAIIIGYYHILKWIF